MNLVIDIGNSNIVSGLIKNKKLLYKFRIKTDRENSTAFDYLIKYKNFLDFYNINLKSIKNIIIGSVVPELDKIFNELFEIHFKTNPIFINVNFKFNTIINIENPKDLGIDRLINSEYCNFIYPKADKIIIDFGTATTFDVINKKDEFIGGLILPGIYLSAKTLFSKTSKLPAIDLHKIPEFIVGNNTETAILSGILNGYASMIESLTIKILKEQNFENTKIILTGGISDIFKKILNLDILLDKDITLKGLNLIYEKNFL